MEQNRIRIILLEDNDANRKLLCRLFDRRGYEVFAFPTPAVCPLQRLPECRCDGNERCADIILSDLDMPLVTGLQFIENQKQKNCKVVHAAIMSGNWQEDAVLKARELGCKIFHKPFEIREINDWLDEIDNSTNLERRLTDWLKEPADGE